MPIDPLRLAKSQIDIGLFTNNLTGHLAFWREAVGLRLDHVLDTGEGNRQHRFMCTAWLSRSIIQRSCCHVSCPLDSRS